MQFESCRFISLVQLFVYNFTPLKRILALPTWGQKCIISELQALEKSKMKVEHPVSHCISQLFILCKCFIKPNAPKCQNAHRKLMVIHDKLKFILFFFSYSMCNLYLTTFIKCQTLDNF